MFESYQLEVIKKRRAARIFWVIVFFFAFFLYFFFQGYYPDVRVGLQRIFSESGSENWSGSTELIRSFGIINVRTIPADATISLGSGGYINNEKRMSDYGDYTMNIEKTNYLSNQLAFRIDREKPFFIEKISLLPIPTYQKVPWAIDAYGLGNGIVLVETASGIQNPSGYLTGSIFGSGDITHIGWRYFRTNTGILSWENGIFKKTKENIENFIETCENVTWKYDILYCPKSQSILSEKWIYMTGILAIENSLIEKSGAILEIKNGEIGTKWTQSGSVELSEFINIDTTLYKKKSGQLLANSPQIENISTLLDTINQVHILGETTVFLWIKSGNPHLIVRHAGDPIDREKHLDLPNHIPYTDAKLHTLDGNIMIESMSGILLVYRGSNDYHWIVEWSILSYTETGALYKKDDGIWKVDWAENIIQ